MQRFFGVPDNETLAALLAESAQFQHEVTDQLGLQVRHAVELLVQAIDSADRERQGALMADVPLSDLYQAAEALGRPLEVDDRDGARWDGAAEGRSEDLEESGMICPR